MGTVKGATGSLPHRQLRKSNAWAALSVNAFTAAQAAQKRLHHGKQPHVEFTAAQAAQKFTKSMITKIELFTAAQAAQKSRTGAVVGVLMFTAAQAAQKRARR